MRVLESRRGLQVARAHRVGVFETQGEEFVFCFSFHAGPVQTAFFAAVGAGARDVAEGEVGVVGQDGLRETQREGVGEFLVQVFVHAHGGDAKAEEAGIVVLYGTQRVCGLEEIRDQQLLDFRVFQTAVFASDNEHFCDFRMVYCFVEDAFAHHAGGACDDDFHASDLLLKVVNR